MKKTNKRGFTLIELMIVVAIIGILAAVAIPAFINYMKRAKTSEATLNLKSIAEGAVSYYDTHGNNFPAATGITPTNCDPGAEPMPMDTTNEAAFNTEAWQNIGWKPHKAFLYCYEFERGDEATTTSDGNAANAYAYGDLDGDDTNSTFTRAIARTSGLVKPMDVSISDELE